MPTTSATGAKAAIAKAEGFNHCLRFDTNRKDASIISINNVQYNYDNNCLREEMVARESSAANIADSGGAVGVVGSNNVGTNPNITENATNTHDIGNIIVNNSNDNHKIILKLPKASSNVAATTSNMMQDESHIDADVTTSSSSSSSNSYLAEDTRKVEPLKINLNAHNNQNVVPKITIRPIVQTQSDPTSASASDYSSSAEDDVGSAMQQKLEQQRNNCIVPKITIKSSSMTSDGNNEPHIVPKLTIRSANEEDGTANTSIVPKLTIKMSDTQSNSIISSAVATSIVSSSNLPHQLDQVPPPLPKLTIKTSQDGTSESIISTISPASLSSSSSSSSSISALTTSSGLFTATSTATSSMYCQNVETATVPKLTIKTVLKPEDTVVPKLTIKTNASGTCVSTSDELIDQQLIDSPGSKIPKLTIKTGQEHAVIITQHNNPANAQSIPKLTIKTKSLESDESHLDSNDDPQMLPDKIPKLTIKTNDSNAQVSPKFSLKATPQQVEGGDAVPPIPKLTITVSNLESISAPQSPLMVRQLSTPSRKSEMTERVPKLMISRHDATSIIMNHSDNAEKVVPKLTIKTNNSSIGTASVSCSGSSSGNSSSNSASIELTDSKDRLSKFAIKSNSLPEDDKIPKLTIKQIPAKHQHSHQQQQQSFDVIDKCLHIDPVHQDLDTHAKIVPKITIKNLSSPKLKMKVVLDDKKSNDMKSNSLDARFNIPNAISDKDMEKYRLLSTTAFVNGESSNSQEFMGFYSNTDESLLSKSYRQDVNRRLEDMNIDEYEMKKFNNVAVDFTGRNGKTLLAESKIDFMKTSKRLLPATAIAMVDLTSSPSPGSSPAHFNCNADATNEGLHSQHKQTSPLLLECLQRKTSVIHTASGNENSSNFLLNQLTAPHSLNHLVGGSTVGLPSKPSPLISNSHISEKYPQLAERLMANGAHPSLRSNNLPLAVPSMEPTKREKIIDSIEILDTPEGSPRPQTSPIVKPAQVTNVNHASASAADEAFVHEKANLDNASLKRNSSVLASDSNLQNEDAEVPPTKIRRQEDAKALTSPNIFNDHGAGLQPSATKTQTPHRSRKQKHENLLKVPIEEEDPLHLTSNDRVESSAVPDVYKDAKESPTINTPLVKKRGRPKKVNKVEASPTNSAIKDSNANNEPSPKSTKTRLSRVQLLRKRLAIDMVASEQPPSVINETEELDALVDVTPTRERPLRTPVRSARRGGARNVLQESGRKNNEGTKKGRKRLSSNADGGGGGITSFNHFGGSNSSLSSACSSSSMSSTTVNAAAAAGVGGSINSVSASSSTINNNNLLLNSQIDLTMSSSSSSTSNGSTTATLTTVAAQGHSNSMLPPTTILSSSDPVPDVIFKPNDFSSIMAVQQLRGPHSNLMNTSPGDRKGNRINSQDYEDSFSGNSAYNSGEDSIGFTSAPTTPTRGRGRGRGSRGGRGSAGASGRGTRGYRIGRGASAVTKAIAMSRPRCIGGLKHTPDPERLKNLFSPSPQVFEEDTRMSADLSQSQQMEAQTFIRQPDFITNEESQSSMVSNVSTLDTNSQFANGPASGKKIFKKKKMEVCVSEDTDFTVTSIAEYDWPPPKGCCPSKNRDTFMIQEQVALYLGIKSFKRKYPDLPRRQIDMEERNWLQEKGLVTEKMCDLGITAVWASDVLDIMYTDFPDKYEEYKDFIRQKHLREIKAKQRSLGINVSDRGLQARDRAMLSASKWNSYFNRSRQDERLSCLDLQTLTVNVPLPTSAPITTLVNRPIAESIALATKAESMPEPPMLLQPRQTDAVLCPEMGYPLALAPGQYSENYRKYSSLELRSYPLNTVLDDPTTLHERLRAQNADDSDANANNISRNMTVRRYKRKGRFVSVKINCDTMNDKVDATKQKEDTISLNSSSSDSSSSEDSDSETDSDTESGASSSSSSDDESPQSRCEVCHRAQNCNLKNLPEVFIECFTCCRKVHPSCIEMPHRMVGRVRNYNWQCADCKCCIKCKRKQDRNKMLFCEQCDRGFHIYCLGVKAVPDGRWSCERCSVCMRCGATKPEGLTPQQQGLTSPNGEKVKQIKYKKVKWINEYRIDHITKLREHCMMLCVPCGRTKSTPKRVPIPSASSPISTSAGTTAANALNAQQEQQSPQHLHHQSTQQHQQQQQHQHNQKTIKASPQNKLSTVASVASSMATPNMSGTGNGAAIPVSAPSGTPTTNATTTLPPPVVA